MKLHVPAMVTITAATTPADIVIVRQLFEAYARSLTVDLCFQGFAAELASLPGAYAEPRGRLLLATEAGTPVGCVALRPHQEHAGEMKRLYVDPRFQGRGIGRQLVTRVITEARQLGYTSLLLDTLPSMHAALKLYAALGFTFRAPYGCSPPAETLFMELSLASAANVVATAPVSR